MSRYSTVDQKKEKIELGHAAVKSLLKSVFMKEKIAVHIFYGF